MPDIAPDSTTPPPSEALKPEQLLQMLRQMLVIRRFEERSAQSYQQNKIGGFLHLYIGQEAVAVGSIAALRPDDPIITAYRDHGHALARGMAPGPAMAELFGKTGGCCQGKGGSMHLFDRPHHMYGGHGIVAGQVPLGVGIAFALQYRGEDKVCVCYLGDGALNQGAFHESMNLAAIWRLPIVFAVENNMYSMGTHIARGTSMADQLEVKAAAYGIRYATCDGMGVLKVYDCFVKEVARTRAGDGPCFINVETYRFKGHSISDPQKYRTKEEIQEYEEHDCIQRLVRRLIGRSLATQEQLDQIDAEAKQVARDAVAFADQSPPPAPEDLITDLYAQPFSPYPPDRNGPAVDDDEESRA